MLGECAILLVAVICTVGPGCEDFRGIIASCKDSRAEEGGGRVGVHVLKFAFAAWCRRCLNAWHGMACTVAGQLTSSLTPFAGWVTKLLWGQPLKAVSSTWCCSREMTGLMGCMLLHSLHAIPLFLSMSEFEAGGMKQGVTRGKGPCWECC